MIEKTIILIRKGLNGFPYSVCDSDGKFFKNADSIEQIRAFYKEETKMGRVQLKKEITKYPEGKFPHYTTYGYARVSTRKQAEEGNGLEVQEQELREAGADVVVREHYTGATTQRPELDKLLDQIKPGDTLMVTRLDRIARSAIQGEKLIRKLLDQRIRVNILNMGVLDNSPASKLTRTMFFAFAEFERDLIVERTQEGKEIARKKAGYREGRPRIAKDRMDKAMELLKTESYNQVAREMNISKSSLIREKNRRKDAGDE